MQNTPPAKQVLLLFLPALALSGSVPARAVVYANITSVKARQLTNGVQVIVQSDGVLEFGGPGGGGRFRGGGENKTSLISVSFPGARSALGSNFINVAEYPVSYVQIQVPQNAPNGVGIEMSIALFTPSSYSITQSPDQQSVLITVNSERTLAMGRPPASAAASGGAETAETVELRPDNTVRVRATDADIHSLLARLAHLTGLDIAVDDRVNRKVSLSLDGMSADAVIHAIASGYGLALSQIDGVYMVSEGVPTDLATYHLSGTQSFRMNYLQAQQASGLLPTFLFQYLHVNPGQNAVVVTAPDQMLAKIGADLNSLDVPPPLIEVDALAVEFSDTNALNESLGMTMHRRDRTTSFDTASGAVQYQTVSKLPFSFGINLNALIQQGRAQIKARPRLAVVNGQSANIFIGDEKYIQVQFNSFGGVQTKIQGVDVGTHLLITPWTGGNGEITTRIQPEVSNISDVDLQNGLPILSDRKADTTVRVKDGDTIIIGGLVQRQHYTTRGKIPLLGDIPIIGNLFRSRKDTDLHTELAIFITPHILDAQGHLADQTPAERATEQKLLHSMEDSHPAPTTPSAGAATAPTTTPFH